MPVPDHDLSKGTYFGNINGFTADRFETVKQGVDAPYEYRSAILEKGVMYFYNSGSPIDVNTLAYMPFIASSATGNSAKYFNRSIYCSAERKCDDFIFVTSEDEGSYPVSMALKGYRTFTSDKSYSSGLFWPHADDYYSINVVYYCWNTLIIDQSLTENEDLIITLTSSGYTISDGDFTAWPTGNRYWIGMALQAGGGAGGDGWPIHTGGGGSGGGYWCGLVPLTSRPLTLKVTGYKATTDGRDGSDISLYYSETDVQLEVNGGGYDFGGSSTGESKGGEVVVYNESLLTYLAKTGGYGGGKKQAGEGVEVSAFIASSSDQKSISFTTKEGPPAKTSGGGGSSVMANGAPGVGKNTHGSDSGVGINSPRYGAGGSGASVTNLFGKRANGGSGGYPYIIIGY